MIRAGLSIIQHEINSGLTDKGVLSETYKNNMINEINMIVF